MKLSVPALPSCGSLQPHSSPDVLPRSSAGNGKGKPDRTPDTSPRLRLSTRDKILPAQASTALTYFIEKFGFAEFLLEQGEM